LDIPPADIGLYRLVGANPATLIGKSLPMGRALPGPFRGGHHRGPAAPGRPERRLNIDQRFPATNKHNPWERPENRERRQQEHIMQYRNKGRIIVLAAAIAALVSGLNAQEKPLFTGHVANDSIMFEPATSAAIESEVDLIIVGPENFHFRKRFAPGQLQEFRPASLAADGLPDGVFKYEIQIMSRPGVQPSRNAATAGLESNTPKPEGGFGTFMILDGSMVEPTALEAPDAGGSKFDSGDTVLTDDDAGTRQVISGDLTVYNSLCVGFDCATSESFGADTIRLKENNLRIHFEDTSTAGSFPSNDWRIVANSNLNGGLNKFSIDDVSGGRTPFTIEAGAPSNSLYVENSGELGIGTTSPVLEVHAVSGDTPGLRLEQNGSSGFAPQVWDVAGNETSFFVRDATNGSTLPFRIRPGSASNSLVVDDGNVGVGVLSPTSKLHVSTTQASGMTLTMTETGNSAGTGPGSDQNWELTIRDFDGGLGFNDPETTGAEMYLSTDGNLTLKGTLTTATQTIPDYVFDDNYVLRPLDEVASFIDAFGHLPGIPSAEEYAERGGVNLSELQVLLLEKVEELTLYTLQQQDTMLQQQHTINQLQREIEALKTARK